MVRPALLAVTLSLAAASIPFAQDPLDERLDAAVASSALRRAYFDAVGDPPLTLGQAFPHLAGAPLADPSFLANRRRMLIAREDACASERLRAPTDRATRVAATCDAEDAAALLEQKLLSSLTAGLELAPELTLDAVERARQPWREAREHASGMSEEDDDFPEASRAALAATEAERQLLLLQTSALRRMAIPSDETLERLVEAELSSLAPSSELDAGARDRLRRAAPLVSEELSRSIALALGLTNERTQQQSGERGESDSEPSDDATSPEDGSLGSATTVLENERVRHAAFEKSIRELESEYADLEAEFAATRTLTILDASRETRMQEIFRGVGELLASTRTAFESLASARREHDEERRQLESAPDAVDGRARAELASALDDRDANTLAEASSLLSLEKRALVFRRVVSPFAEESLTSQAFVDELAVEMEHAPRWLELEWRENLRWLRSLPRRATDVNSVAQLLELSFDLLVLALVWLYVRRQSARWLRRLVDAFQKKEISSFGFTHRPLRVSNRELEPVARYGTDAIGAFVLHRLLEPRTEILALAALVWVGWALLRSVPAAIRLLLPILGRALDPLEAEGEPPPEILTLGVRTSNWFLRWWILSEIAAFTAVPLLQADRLLRLVTLASWAIFLLLAVVALAQWTPWIRHFVSNLADQSAVTVWLGRPVKSKLQRMARSAIGAVYIVLRLIFWVLVDRGWLTRSGTSIALSQLKVADASPGHLSPAERDQIRAASGRTIARTEELEKLVGAFEQWRREERRGVVAVVGDRGMGKSVFLEQAGAMLEGAAPDVPVTKLELPVRKRSASLREKFSWLTDPFDIQIPKNANRDSLQSTIVDHLEALPPHVVLVDDLHLLLRRTVGGFEDLELARNIIQACANEHFWVLSLHRPAWVYVDGVSAAMKMAFREHLELPALDADELGESLVERTRAAGFEPKFRTLLKGHRPYADQESLEHKARRLYWRLVSQSSNGNPRIVIDFWLQSLGAVNGDGEEGNKSVPVYLFAGHRDDEIESMSDEYLFLLTALVVHDGMKLEDLADVLNVPRSKVRVTCQHLESLGIVDCIHRRYLITTVWQPTIARVLDRRNFAHK